MRKSHIGGARPGDAAYLRACRDGDTAAAREIVLRAARDAGFVLGPVWHGTDARFTAFDTSCEGAHFGTEEQASALRGKGRLRLRPYMLAIRNPLRLPDIGVWDNFNGLHAHLERHGHISPAQAERAWAEWMMSGGRGWAAIKAALRERGFDGIAYENELEGPGLSYIALEASQIRSAAPIERDRGGRIIPPSRRFAPDHADFRGLPPARSAAPPPPGPGRLGPGR